MLKIPPLRQCPFCGFNAEPAARSVPDSVDRMIAFIRCKRCKGQTYIFPFSDSSEEERNFAFNRVAELWNSRYNDTGER